MTSRSKKEITTFKKVTNDEKRAVDLMLFYVEQGVEFTSSFGDVSEGFYTSMIKMFDQVAIECDRDENLYKIFSERLYNVVSNGSRRLGIPRSLTGFILHIRVTVTILGCGSEFILRCTNKYFKEFFTDILLEGFCPEFRNTRDFGNNKLLIVPERLQNNIIGSLGEYTEKVAEHFDNKTEA